MARPSFRKTHHVRKAPEALYLREDAAAHVAVTDVSSNSHSLILLPLFMIIWTILPSQLSQAYSMKITELRQLSKLEYLGYSLLLLILST